VSGPRQAQRRARVIGVVASAGGPGALASVIERLPPGKFAPLLIVQHVAKGFAEGLARWLSATGNPVVVAEHGVVPERGHAYIAPDDRHLGLALDGTISISEAPPVGLFRPSCTWMLSSLARALGPDAGAIVLTGMGVDGAAGALEVRRAGGDVVAQDEASSVVFGMPQAAIALGATDEVLPLVDIAQWIVDKSTVIR
nr:CheB methylesterase domain-containing protein [Myxococcota bacterium]